jgi:hypothetical protein
MIELTAISFIQMCTTQLQNNPRHFKSSMMNRWRASLALILMASSFGHSMKFGVEKMSHRRFGEIASHVGDIMSDYNAKNPEKTNDVAIIKFENDPNNFFVEKLLEHIPKENAVMMPQMKMKVTHQQIRTVAFIIILADNFEVVRGKVGENY